MSWTMRNQGLSPYDPLAATFASMTSLVRSRWERAVENAIERAGGMVHEGGPVASFRVDETPGTELTLSLLDADGNRVREIVMTVDRG